ncbi:hypothetical protein [Hungatella effluvii]|uniref:hypothetical protein n=1 Tax=Hungatella effluvii TaxID=1096246 RepID=UPI0022E27A28|nr:hypothetical protein [Hungatella effluvii]
MKNKEMPGHLQKMQVAWHLFKSSRKKGGSRQEGDPAGFEYEKKFYVEKVFTLFTSINIPNECEDYLMKM